MARREQVLISGNGTAFAVLKTMMTALFFVSVTSVLVTLSILAAAFTSKQSNSEI